MQETIRGGLDEVRVVLYCPMFVFGDVVLIGGLVCSHAYVVTGASSSWPAP